jgi:hypothetical protein
VVGRKSFDEVLRFLQANFRALADDLDRLDLLSLGHEI